jgi:ABC-type antimicrobial peptide transport system permease subunit
VSARIVVQALRLGALGLVIGIAAALATTRLLRSLLIGVAPSDPLSLVLVSVVLLGVVALASYLPAHRAARVSPVEALRAE